MDVEAAASQAIEGLKDEDWELDAMQKRQDEADEEAEASDEEKLVRASALARLPFVCRCARKQ